MSINVCHIGAQYCRYRPRHRTNQRARKRTLAKSNGNFTHI